MKCKIILLSFWASIMLISCHQKNIEIKPTNKYIAIYDKLKNKSGYIHSYGYIFEIKNNMSKNLTLDTVIINLKSGSQNNNVYELFDIERPLSKILVQNDTNCEFLTDTLIILPGQKKKIMLFVGRMFRSIPDAKKLLKVCWVNDINFYFHTSNDTIIITKNTKSIHKLLNDKIQYFIDNKQIDSIIINKRYKKTLFDLD